MTPVPTAQSTTTQSTTQAIVNTSTTTSRPGGGFTCGTAEGFFTVPGQCTATYYACFAGVAYQQVDLSLSTYDYNVRSIVVIHNFFASSQCIDMPRCEHRFRSCRRPVCPLQRSFMSHVLVDNCLMGIGIGTD